MPERKIGLLLSSLESELLWYDVSTSWKKFQGNAVARRTFWLAICESPVASRMRRNLAHSEELSLAFTQ